MKKHVFMTLAMLMTAVVAFATGLTTVPAEGTEVLIDLGTFTGIVAVISTIVTQIFKVIPSISENRLAKIGLSCTVGMVLCLVAWALQLTPLLAGYEWWGSLIYGVAAGLSGCGFYDLVKAIAGLFDKNTPEADYEKEGGPAWMYQP